MFRPERPMAQQAGGNSAPRSDESFGSRFGLGRGETAPLGTEVTPLGFGDETQPLADDTLLETLPPPDTPLPPEARVSPAPVAHSHPAAAAAAATRPEVVLPERGAEAPPHDNAAAAAAAAAEAAPVVAAACWMCDW